MHPIITYRQLNVVFILNRWYEIDANFPHSLGCLTIYIQAFSPSEPLKPGEVFSRQNIPFNIGESQFSLPTTPQELLQQYQVM